MKRAFYVMGVPSSGTRLMVRLLIAAGCVGDGDTKDYQRWNDTPPDEETIVIRRHLPVSPKPPAWSKPDVIRSLQELGYAVHAIIMTRDWTATTMSHLKQRYTDDPAFSYLWTRTLWRQMFEQLPLDVDFDVVTYESLVRGDKSVIPALMGRLGLNADAKFELVSDGNAKYYGPTKRGKK